MTPYIPPKTFEEARLAILRARAKNDDLLAEIQKLKAQRGELRARVAALEARTLRGRLDRLMSRFGYVKASPRGDSGA